MITAVYAVKVSPPPLVPLERERGNGKARLTTKGESFLDFGQPAAAPFIGHSDYDEIS